MMSICLNKIRPILPLIGFALLSVVAAQAQEAASEKTPSASLSNTITGHVVGQGGETINGATAFASQFGVLAPARTTTVDSSGNFKFDALEAGVYSVSASMPGFVAPPVSPDETRHYYHPGDSVTLTLIKGGVITGTVTTATNGPVVAAAVHAFRIKDVNGQAEPLPVQPRERQTDDRGIYRFYGLAPGTYVISVGGQARSYVELFLGAYDNDVPTYAPSSTRDTAMEVLVHSGEEVTADIQYRGESGQVISGTLAGLVQSTTQSMGIATGTITLTDVRSRAVVMTAPSSSLTNNGFAFSGVADGEYEILGQQFLQSRDSFASEPVRVKVQGADITGINLTLNPLASIAGRVVLESNPPADCVKRRASALPETVISVRRSKSDKDSSTGKSSKGPTVLEIPLAAPNQSADTVPDAKGDFFLRNLRRGAYRIDSQLPGTGWYLRSISIGNASTTVKASDPNVPRDGINLKPGERVSGLNITITEGAARLRGRLSAAEGQRVPAGLRVYLVPAERESAENVLRFFEAGVESDAGFVIDNIAPGRYWIIARASEGDPAKVKAVRQDAVLRGGLVREAGILKKEVSFKPCERSSDYHLPWAAQSKQ
ncbi:MAG: hypothetical protein QOG23_361 [Blastocatellia bacterium]|nr:hypothetical protein [Blastocatellia bacterium]